MKKLIAAIVASAFAFASLSGFAAGYEQKAPVQHSVLKSHKVKKPVFHKVKHGKKHHHKRHSHRNHPRTY